MKIKAYQIPPEEQNSPLIQFDAIPDDVSVYGNRHYEEHKSDLLRNLPEIFEEIADELEMLRAGEKPHCDLALILEAYTGRDNYTRAERKKWLDIIRRWEETDEETGVFLDALQLLTGKEHYYTTIWGCCQGDWQHVIYPAEYGAEWLRIFKLEYFNLGTEWLIYEDDDAPAFAMYCYDNPRAEIAEVVNATPEDVELYAFDGWERTPKYKAVEA
jgi:hypothetical protein